MPFDNAALAAVAMAAAKVPLWKKPKATDYGPKITAQSQEGQFHPRIDVVTTALTPLTTTARQSVLQTRLTWLTQRKTAAETALAALGLSTSLPSTLADTTLSTASWPIARVKIRLQRPAYRLKVGLTEKGSEDNTSTDQALAALTDASVIPTAAATPGAAAALLLQMRCLADIYQRWETCAALTLAVVGTQLAVPPLSNAEMLARTLTFSRIEGDMVIPPEDDTLEGTDPGTDASKIPLPPGRSRFFPYLSPSAYMACVTYLALLTGTTLNGASFDLSGPGVITQVADASFTLAMGGLDVLWYSAAQQSALEQLFPGDPPFVPADILDWPALNRQIPTTVTHAAARIAAQADLTARRALLTSSMQGPAGGQASRTTVIAAVDYKGTFSGAAANYAELVLSEGVRYLNRLTYGPVRFGPGSPSRLPEIIVYLLYHMGAESKGLLGSAAANALRPASKSSYAKALSAAMTAAGMGDDLTNTLSAIRKAPTTTESVQIATDNWDTIAPLLGAPTVMTALADYIRNETDKTWTTWAKPPGTPDDPTGINGSSPRGNCIGYAQLYEYLTAQVH